MYDSPEIRIANMLPWKGVELGHIISEAIRRKGEQDSDISITDAESLKIHNLISDLQSQGVEGLLKMFKADKPDSETLALAILNKHSEGCESCRKIMVNVR